MARQIDAAALLCRTSDRTAGAGLGAAALADALQGDRIGRSSEPHVAHWADDLKAARNCIADAGRLVRGSLAAGRFPVLTASDCTIAIGTLPEVSEEAEIVWLDAHGDFNTPSSTPSGFLGGMCLAAACGLWDAGFPAIDPGRVTLWGVRDLDPEEAEAVAAAGLRRDSDPDGPAYVHLDLDVLDPEVMSAQFPVPGGWTFEQLEQRLRRLDVIGVEVTAFEDPRPELVERLATLLRSLA